MSRTSWVATAGVLTALSSTASACGGTTAPPGQPSGLEYRSVVLEAKTVVCARVFRTEADKEKGLMGPDPPAAGAFVNDPPDQPSLWMKDVSRDLEAVWVAPGGAILGSTAMKAETLDTHPAPGVVALIIELSPDLWSRSASATTAQLGDPCTP